jgi:hypothetical protein
MKDINRIERWFNRYNLEDTKRKMIEWNTFDYEIFFLKVFETALNDEEKNLLDFYLEKDNMYNTNNDVYIYQ